MKRSAREWPVRSVASGGRIRFGRRPGRGPHATLPDLGGIGTGRYCSRQRTSVTCASSGRRCRPPRRCTCPAATARRLTSQRQRFRGSAPSPRSTAWCAAWPPPTPGRRQTRQRCERSRAWQAPWPLRQGSARERAERLGRSQRQRDRESGRAWGPRFGRLPGPRLAACASAKLPLAFGWSYMKSKSPGNAEEQLCKPRVQQPTTQQSPAPARHGNRAIQRPAPALSQRQLTGARHTAVAVHDVQRHRLLQSLQGRNLDGGALHEARQAGGRAGKRSAGRCCSWPCHARSPAAKRKMLHGRAAAGLPWNAPGCRTKQPLPSEVGRAFHRLSRRASNHGPRGLPGLPDPWAAAAARPRPCPSCMMPVGCSPRPPRLRRCAVASTARSPPQPQTPAQQAWLQRGKGGRRGAP